MSAILRKDFFSYFRTPVGYIYLAIFYLLSGLFLYFQCLLTRTANMSGVFMDMFQVVSMLLPLLTMRMFSEERRQRTDELLFTSPVSVTETVFGKYLAAFLLYLIASAILIVYAGVLSVFSNLDWGMFFSGYFGMLLLGAANIAVGMFLSTVTENQIIAAVLTLAVSLFFVLADAVSGLVSIKWLQAFLVYLSFFEKYYSFARGIMNLSAVVYFASFAVFFFVLTTYSVKRRLYQK